MGIVIYEDATKNIRCEFCGETFEDAGNMYSCDVCNKYMCSDCTPLLDDPDCPNEFCEDCV